MDQKLSKRVKGAVKRLGQNPEEESDPDEPKPSTSKPKVKRQRTDKAASKGKVPKCVASENLLDTLTERLHKPTVIPQREMDRRQREEQKRKAAALLKAGRGRGIVMKTAPCQSQVALSESSEDST